jgi:hypothetical protein
MSGEVASTTEDERFSNDRLRVMLARPIDGTRMDTADPDRGLQIAIDSCVQELRPVLEKFADYQDATDARAAMAGAVPATSLGEAEKGKMSQRVDLATKALDEEVARDPSVKARLGILRSLLEKAAQPS